MSFLISQRQYLLSTLALPGGFWFTPNIILKASVAEKIQYMEEGWKRQDNVLFFENSRGFFKGKY